MKYFINLKAGKASIQTYRSPDALATDMEDIFSQAGNENSETLTASLNLWIETSAKQVLKDAEGIQFDDINELQDYLLGENDFLGLLENNLGIDHTEDPEIRQLQKDEYEDFTYKLFDRIF